MRKQNMNSDWIATARTLSEALPYLQRYAGAIVVVRAWLLPPSSLVV